MPNRLSPGCCCGCDIFQADFDLRYVLPTIPATAPDWVNSQIAADLFAPVRRIALAVGSPGEGIVFTQPAGSNSAVPVSQASPPRQISVPSFAAHPDPSTIRALPGFSLYVYRIVPNATGVAAGLYQLTPTGRIGPSVHLPSWFVLEPDWSTYWRRSFRLLDAEGEEIEGPDRFPFVLNPGERLESTKSLPNEWFSIVQRPLYYAGFQNDPDSRLTVSLIKENGDVFASVVSRCVSIEGAIEPRMEITVNGETLRILTHEYVSFALRPRWNFRDGHFDIWTSGPSYTSWINAETTDFLEAGWPLLFVDEIPQTRLRIELESSERRLGRLSAERTNGNRRIKEENDEGVNTFTTAPKNPTCPQHQTNPIIWPHHHNAWKIKSVVLPGVESPLLEKYAYGPQSALFVHESQLFADVIKAGATVELPSQWFGGQLYRLQEIPWRSSTPDTTNHPFKFDAFDVDIAVALKPGTTDQVLITTKVSGRYFGSYRLPEPGLIDEETDLGWPETLTLFANHFESEFIPDASLGQNAGWLKTKLGFDGRSNFNWQNPMLPVAHIPTPDPSWFTLRWTTETERWEGDEMPEIELAGAAAEAITGNWGVGSGSGEAARQIVMPRNRTVSASRFGFYNSKITTTGENVAFDLHDLVLTIGGPDAL